MNNLNIALVWQAVFNPPKDMEDWSAYRIEYGGHADACRVEGMIWLPPGADPEEVERLLERMQT